MNIVRTINAALIICALLIPLSGCMKSEGPAEKAGKSLDNATESVGESIEDAGEAMQDAAKGNNESGN